VAVRVGVGVSVGSGVCVAVRVQVGMGVCEGVFEATGTAGGNPPWQATRMKSRKLDRKYLQIWFENTVINSF
jgi:hypothetical protein